MMQHVTTIICLSSKLKGEIKKKVMKERNLRCHFSAQKYRLDCYLLNITTMYITCILYEFQVTFRQAQTLAMNAVIEEHNICALILEHAAGK